MTDSTSEIDSASQDETTEEETDDLLGGLDVDTSRDVSVPDRLLDQVIGQKHARKVVKRAAEQHRHVLMMGSPGTGKSMLAKAMAQILPDEKLQDVLVYPNSEDENNPKVRTVPAGKGERIMDAHKEEVEKRQSLRRFVKLIIAAIVIGYSFLIGSLLLGVIAVGVILFVAHHIKDANAEAGPELLIDNSDRNTAPFKDATGTHDGALLGDVRHDPYQSGARSTPAHSRVEAGDIHKANKGVLFVDEVNTLGIETQQKLMTAIQDGEFHITGQSENSSGSMVKTEPIPTDFIMVAAGNMDALENMHPALRDRLQGYGYEVYMNDTVEDTPEMRRKYVQFIAQEVEKEGLPHFSNGAMREVILEAQRRSGEKGKLTLKLRSLGGLVRDAGDFAQMNGADLVTREHVLKAKESSQSIEQQVVDEHIQQKKKYGVSSTDGSETGSVNGLAVKGEDAGVMLPVMADVTPAHGAGEITATGKLEEIAQESVQNVSSIIKKLGGDTLDDKDIHIQFVQTYEGVDGDSASITIATAVISALTGVPVKQNTAMTGSLSVRGDVLPVGGVTHKVEAAAKAGIEKVIIPEMNEDDLQLEDEFEEQVEVIPVSDIGEVLEHALDAETDWISRLKEKLNRVRKNGIGNLGLKNPTSQSTDVTE